MNQNVEDLLDLEDVELVELLEYLRQRDDFILSEQLLQVKKHTTNSCQSVTKNDIPSKKINRIIQSI